MRFRRIRLFKNKMIGLDFRKFQLIGNFKTDHSNSVNLININEQRSRIHNTMSQNSDRFEIKSGRALSEFDEYAEVAYSASTC